MGTRLNVGKLNLLSVRQVQTVRDADHGDGAGLYLRVSGDSANWIYRFTSASGRRRRVANEKESWLVQLPFLCLHAGFGRHAFSVAYRRRQWE